MNASLTSLSHLIEGLGDIAVAVSGGVDSMTLATLANQILGHRAVMYHAVSPAVPADATARVRTQAAQRGWMLELFDAGEFADPRYRANPTNRCFYCKTNLYGAVRSRTQQQIVSGTNTDDLGEFRPGLDAARNYGVRHPYVEAGLDKPAVRQLAAALGLGEIVTLPAAPCLASRVETGIPIEPAMLELVHSAEKLVASAITPQTVRCRVRAAAVVIELDPASLANLAGETGTALKRSLKALLGAHGIDAPILFARYRTGSAFLRVAAS
jgi:pyridinium-3,5-biscarboxylic acid mononucleotide sulfurtransferase